MTGLPLKRVSSDGPREFWGFCVLGFSESGEDDVILVRLLDRVRISSREASGSVVVLRGLADSDGAVRELRPASEMNRTDLH